VKKAWARLDKEMSESRINGERGEGPLEKLDCAEATTRRREGTMRVRRMGAVRGAADQVRRVAIAAAGGRRGAAGAMAIPPWTAMANWRCGAVRLWPPVTSLGERRGKRGSREGFFFQR
jgi:hypothetical protein